MHGGAPARSAPSLAGLLVLTPFGAGRAGRESHGGVGGLRVTLGAVPPAVALFLMSHLEIQGIWSPECSQRMFDPGSVSFGTAEGDSGVGGLCETRLERQGS